MCAPRGMGGLAPGTGSKVSRSKSPRYKEKEAQDSSALQARPCCRPTPTPHARKRLSALSGASRGPGAKPWGFPRLPDHKPRHWLMPLWGEQRCGHGAPGGPHPGTCDSLSQGPVSWCPIPSPSGAPFQLCDLGPLNLSMPRFPHLETCQDARPM